MIKKKLRILLAEGDPAETTAGLRELYPESQDGLELTIVSTIPTLIATLEIVNPESHFRRPVARASRPVGGGTPRAPIGA
jgi:hypothetical protein